MNIGFGFNGPGIALCLALVCWPAMEGPVHASLPAEVPMNPEAGRGGNLIVTVQLEDGQELPMILDTGAGSTVFDQSLKRRLGKPRGSVAMNSFRGISTNNVYTAPKLFWGGVPLMMTGTEIVTWDVKRLSAHKRHPVMGILGIDVLEHYCIQLDFAARKIRFLDDQHTDKSKWGKAFPIVPLADQDPRPAVAQNLLGLQGPHSLIDTGFIGDDGSLMPKYFQLWTNHVIVPTNGQARSPDGVFGGEKYPLVHLSKLDWPSDGIGLGFLARHLVTFDFPNHTMYLLRQSIGPPPSLRLTQLKPIPDKEPEVTAHVRAMLQDWIDNTEHADDYTAPAWKNLLSKQEDIQAFTKSAGDVVSLTLVERRSGMFGWRRSYGYRVEFTKATVLAHFVFHGRNKLASGNLEPLEWKEPAAPN